MIGRLFSCRPSTIRNRIIIVADTRIVRSKRRDRGLPVLKYAFMQEYGCLASIISRRRTDLP